jgi:hypothetical protein
VNWNSDRWCEVSEDTIPTFVITKTQFRRDASSCKRRTSSSKMSFYHVTRSAVFVSGRREGLSIRWPASMGQLPFTLCLRCCDVTRLAVASLLALLYATVQEAVKTVQVRYVRLLLLLSIRYKEAN